MFYKNSKIKNDLLCHILYLQRKKAIVSYTKSFCHDVVEGRKRKARGMKEATPSSLSHPPVWVLHIAKVGSIPSPYLGNMKDQKL